MSAVEGLLLTVVIVLTLAVGAMLVLGLHLLKKLNVPSAPPLVSPRVTDDGTEATAERERQTLIELQAAVGHAQSALEHERRSVASAQAEAIAARAESAAAKAEVSTARSEAQRVLDNAHSEAVAVLERAHHQAEEDAGRLRATAKRTGER